MVNFTLPRVLLPQVIVAAVNHEISKSDIYIFLHLGRIPEPVQFEKHVFNVFFFFFFQNC